MMKTLLISAALMSTLSMTAMADLQIDIAADALPVGATLTNVSAMVGGVPYDAVVTGPAGFPPAYQCVWLDAFMPPFPSPVSMICADYDCGGPQQACIMEGVDYPPFSVFFFPGPATPPTGPTAFPFEGPCEDGSAVDLMPTAYDLKSAYPNPFNPSTTLSFDMVDAGVANLSVYNIMGQKVATLINGMTDAGSHSVVFDASSLASGVYMYTLEANGFSQTKKMVLAK